MEILTFFVKFWLNGIQNGTVKIKKMKDGIFNYQFEKKYFCRTLTDDTRHSNASPLLGLTRILKSCHERSDRREFPDK